MNNSAVDYETDLRIPCQYGSSCYRKNEDHQKKFKHPTFSKVLIVIFNFHKQSAMY